MFKKCLEKSIFFHLDMPHAHWKACCHDNGVRSKSQSPCQPEWHHHRGQTHQPKVTRLRSATLDIVPCLIPRCFVLSQGGWCGSLYVSSPGPHPPGCQVTSCIDILQYNHDMYVIHLQICSLVVRATALLLSVSHLVLVTRNACHMSGSLDWIDQSLHAAEDHMVVLREAALASEPERCLPEREQSI